MPALPTTSSHYRDPSSCVSKAHEYITVYLETHEPDLPDGWHDVTALDRKQLRGLSRATIRAHAPCLEQARKLEMHWTQPQNALPVLVAIKLAEAAAAEPGGCQHCECLRGFLRSLGAA